mmetsp:Transcript_8256/g.22964  ORF Transcript_8256/g.22964 Transcript_8256/m.22964 type:complete len:263 (+) Transcript_8256:137-925(+)
MYTLPRRINTVPRSSFDELRGDELREAVVARSHPRQHVPAPLPGEHLNRPKRLQLADAVPAPELTVRLSQLIQHRGHAAQLTSQERTPVPAVELREGLGGASRVRRLTLEQRGDVRREANLSPEAEAGVPVQTRGLGADGRRVRGHVQADRIVHARRRGRGRDKVEGEGVLPRDEPPAAVAAEVPRVAALQLIRPARVPPALLPLGGPVECLGLGGLDGVEDVVEARVLGSLDAVGAKRLARGGGGGLRRLHVALSLVRGSR